MASKKIHVGPTCIKTGAGEVAARTADLRAQRIDEQVLRAGSIDVLRNSRVEIEMDAATSFSSVRSRLPASVFAGAVAVSARHQP